MSSDSSVPVPLPNGSVAVPDSATTALAPTAVRGDFYEIERQIRRLVFSSRAVIALTVAIFAGWSFFAPLAVGTHAMGKVVAESHNQPIQNKEGGVVKALYVKEGAFVTEGQPLIDIQSVQAVSDFNITAEQLARDLIGKAFIKAELEGSSEPDLRELDDVKSLSARNRALLIEQERGYMETRRQDSQSKLELFNKQIDQVRKQIEGLRDQNKGLRRQLELIGEELASLKFLDDRALVAKTRVRSTERDQEGIRVTIGANETQVAQNEAQVLTIEQQKADQIQQYRSSLTTDLKQKIVAISQGSERVVVLQDVINRSTLVAPQAGQVVGLSVFAREAVVGPGQLLMSLVPANEGMICEVNINPLEIDKVSAGSTVDVRFSGLPRKSAPMLKGKLLSVSKDVISPQSSSQSAGGPPAGSPPVYFGRVLLTPDELARITNHTIVAGMPVEVLINSGQKRTVVDYLVSPWLDLAFRSMTER